MMNEFVQKDFYMFFTIYIANFNQSWYGKSN